MIRGRPDAFNETGTDRFLSMAVLLPLEVWSATAHCFKYNDTNSDPDLRYMKTIRLGTRYEAIQFITKPHHGPLQYIASISKEG